MPSTLTSLAGVYMAGDWLAQGPGTHGAKGLSQEKAYVTGLQAGNQVRHVSVCTTSSFAQCFASQSKVEAHHGGYLVLAGKLTQICLPSGKGNSG